MANSAGFLESALSSLGVRNVLVPGGRQEENKSRNPANLPCNFLETLILDEQVQGNSRKSKGLHVKKAVLGAARKQCQIGAAEKAFGDAAVARRVPESRRKRLQVLPGHSFCRRSSACEKPERE